jgi:hypothetical protein
MSILRKRIESIFAARIAEELPAQDVMKGHDTGDRDDQPGVTIFCKSNQSYEDFPARSGVYQCNLILIVESNSQDSGNTQDSIESLIVSLTDAIEDLTAVQTLCAASFDNIHIHDIIPTDDAPEAEGYNLDNSFNYLLVYEYLNV